MSDSIFTEEFLHLLWCEVCTVIWNKFTWETISCKMCLQLLHDGFSVLSLQFIYFPEIIIYILTAGICEFVFCFSRKLRNGFLSNFVILFSLLLSGALSIKLNVLLRLFIYKMRIWSKFTCFGSDSWSIHSPFFCAHLPKQLRKAHHRWFSHTGQNILL